MSKPTVSIVILCYNEEDTIVPCLEAVAQQTDHPDEVIVVDNNSTDNSVALAEAFGFVRVVHEPVQGMSPARNRGIAEAKSEVVGRIDADSRLDPDWVANVRRCFSDESVDATSGPVVYADMPAERVGAALDKNVRLAITRLTEDTDFRLLFGTNMAVRKSSWEDIVDELCDDDVVHEDIDIALHMHRAGMKVVFEKHMVAGMLGRRLEDRPKDFYKYIMKWQRTFERHPTKSIVARTPMFIYLSIYFPLKMLRAFYDAEEKQLSFKKAINQAKTYFKVRENR